MSIARIYNRTLHRELRCHAAWLPFANGARLGDYGVISGGVFQRMGSVADLGVAVEASAEATTTTIDFASESTRVVRMAGDIEVKVFPDEPIQARLSFEFARSESLLVKAAEIRVHELADVAGMARRLAKTKHWKHHYKVVRQVWTAQDAMVVATQEANTTVSFAASAGVLKRFELGDVSAEVETTSTHRMGLELVARSGPVGLGLFRVRLLGGAALRTRQRGDNDTDDVDTSATWDADLEDDL